jgi:hypothetical protein
MKSLPLNQTHRQNCGKTSITNAPECAVLNLKTMTLPSYQIKIYLSGSIEVAKQVIREHILEKPLCVTIEPTTYIYTGGEEAGYVVGLLNYPRFPKPPNELAVRASILAELLLARTFQRSALIVSPETTQWLNSPHNKLLDHP